LYGVFVKNQGQYYEMQRYLRSLALPNQGVVVSTPEMIGYVYSFLDGSAVFVLPDNWMTDSEQTAARLRAFALAHSQVWLVLDYSRGEDARQGFLERNLENYGPKSTNRWFKTFRLAGFVSPNVAHSLAMKNEGGVYGSTLQLEGFTSPERAEDGQALRLGFRWLPIKPMSADYQLFVHLVSPEGKIVAQRDKMMANLGQPTTTWHPESSIRDIVDLLIPTGTPPVDYQIIAGVYRPNNGERLKREDGSDAITLGTVIVTRSRDQFFSPRVGKPVNLDNQILALGYEVDGKPRAGVEFDIGLFLKPTAAIRGNFGLVIGLLREGSIITAGDESTPGGRSYPPEVWQRDEIVREVRRLKADEAGRYTVVVKAIAYDGTLMSVGSGSIKTVDGWVTLPGDLEIVK
jgi:hypothetical protein